jgi:hypothetical protein
MERSPLRVGLRDGHRLPLLVEKPGRTHDEAPQRWQGQRVRRSVEVEYSDGRVTQEEVRVVVVHSSQLAQQQPQTYAAAPVKEAEAVADHVRQVHARWFACLLDAETALAVYACQGPGCRGRHPRPWRYHTVRDRLMADTHRTRRARQGRPAKMDPPLLNLVFVRSKIPLRSRLCCWRSPHGSWRSRC